MTKLQVDDFSEFFAAVNNGKRPFSWQCETVKHVATTGHWPDQISAPTGSGKSFVVEAHLFLNALAAEGTIPRVPRRLHTVVNRRGLVDNQHQKAEKIQGMLTNHLEDENTPLILKQVAVALHSLCATKLQHPFQVSVLRGGLSTRSLPVDDLTSCAVIASTPDMFGSRALFQGYGSTLYARPRETTLMTWDSVIVLDEAHLNRQLLATVRRIREIQLAGKQVGVPPLQVVETTATPASGNSDLTTVSVDPENLISVQDDVLRDRLFATKTIHHVEINKWPGHIPNKTVVSKFVSQITSWLESSDRTGPVGCIVNHVDTAVEIARNLRKHHVKVVLLVGRLRPFDLEQLQLKYPNLLTPTGNSEVDVIVATQTLEVGVDVDFQHLITELAPATSLQQRIGRLNRLGHFEKSELVVVEPADATKLKDIPPYKAVDLTNGYIWIRSFGEGSDINPARISFSPAPPSAPARLLYQRVEFRDIELLAKTSEFRNTPPDLSLWLRDSFDDEQPVAGVAVRYGLPEIPEAAVELLNNIPPRAEEVFPGTISTVRALTKELLDTTDEDNNPLPLFIYSSGDVSTFTSESTLKPGDVVVLGAKVPITTENVLRTAALDKYAPQEVPIPDSDVYVQGVSKSVDDSIFRSARTMDPSEFVELWCEHFPQDQGRHIEVSASTVEDSKGDMVAWILVRDAQTIRNDAEALQEMSPGVQGTVQPATLDSHQAAVAERSKAICESLGISENVTRSIIVASSLHDEGKQDPRFQRMLGNKDSNGRWAKSKKRSKQEQRRAKAASGLPLGWRHEQLSAVVSEKMREQGDTRINDLVTHIIGVSHGRGRDLFRQIGEQVNAKSEIAHSLFTEGIWESRVRKLTREYGAYTLALCESIERAADAQVSGEGR